MHWIFKETTGVLIILGAIIYLPVVISDYSSPKDMPFRPKPPAPKTANVFPSDAETRQKVVDVLAKQLNAIRAESFEEAYKYASLGIRQQIPLAEFERMVRIQFQPMLEFERLEVSEVFDDGEKALVRTRLSDEGLPIAIYSYVMTLEDGQWHVGGVLPDGAIQTIAPPPSTSIP